VYTVHTHSSLPSALLSSNRTPRCSMMHPASAPRAIPQLGAEPSPASVGFPTQQKISAQAVFGACHPRGSYLHQSGSSSHPKRSRQNEPHAFRGGLGLQEKACGVSDLLLGRPERHRVSHRPHYSSASGLIALRFLNLSRSGDRPPRNGSPCALQSARTRSLRLRASDACAAVCASPSAA
jgi:hypothetical protein